MNLAASQTRPPLKSLAWLTLPIEKQRQIVQLTRALNTAHSDARNGLSAGIAPEGFVPETAAIRKLNEQLSAAIFEAIPLHVTLEPGMSYTGHIGMMEALAKVTTSRNAEGLAAFPDIATRLQQISDIRAAAQAFVTQEQSRSR